MYEKIANAINNKKLDWNEYFFTLALIVSARSDCQRRRFGTVIVSPDKRVLATGYNAPPLGNDSCTQRGITCKKAGMPANSAYDSCLTIHSEANALMFLGQQSSKDYQYIDLYIAGRHGETGELLDVGTPCIHCSRLINNFVNIRYIHTLNKNGEYKTFEPKDLIISI